MVELKNLLRMMVEKDGSDLHLKVGRPPVIRIRGDLVDVDVPALTSEDTDEMSRFLMPDYQKVQFAEKSEADFAYSLAGVGRFRVNVFRQRGSVGAVLRRVRVDIPTFAQLNLPPVFEKIASYERGIVLVTGTTSSGKSTSLAAIIDYINARRRAHILTIEDPIEYVHRDQQSIVNQREIGLDTASFGAALKYMVRQDPDIIVIGEMRDADTFEAAVLASETGHIIFSTLHAHDTTQVVDRILNFFPPPRHAQIRMQLALNLRAITSQWLLPRADGTGQVPAVEVLVNTPTVHKLVLENRVMRLPQAIQNGAEDGMRTFNQSLVELIQNKMITEETALSASTNPDALKMNLRGIYLDEERKLLGE